MLRNGLSRFLDPVTASKVRFIDGSDVDATLDMFLPTELSAWVKEEIRLNQIRPLPEAQSCSGYWKQPANPSDHDPRGCDSYVRKYLSGAIVDSHIPHPNIVEDMKIDTSQVEFAERV